MPRCIKGLDMLIDFWGNLSLDVDLTTLRSSAVSVKGKTYRDPCRFLEIYGNTSQYRQEFKKSYQVTSYSDEAIRETFIPKIPNVKVEIGENIYQPPFVWNDCCPTAIPVNFTYNTNAIYRILHNLSLVCDLPEYRIDNLLDDSCLLLSMIYRSNNYEIMRYMNNNINMFLISKVIEMIVGKDVYDSEQQETQITGRALSLALKMAEDHASLGPREQMGLALGKGIAFVEKHSYQGNLTKDISQSISEITYKYTEGRITIDDRQKLIDMVQDADDKSNEILMCAILDDTAESVDDLLWMQGLMVRFPRFKVNLLVNLAQISINFSAAMLETVLASEYFAGLRERLGHQLIVTRIYYPLISFQTNLLPPQARAAIQSADFVYVKGLNFFETCQVFAKDTFYAFVVYGPISRMYTGCEDFDGIFAFIPAGFSGYTHNSDPSLISTLCDIWRCLNLLNIQTTSLLNA
jgi:hypothetical protein